MRKLLITGGAGFIGSHVVKYFVKKYKNYQIYNLDKLTYAANLENLKEIQNAKNYVFVKGDICDEKILSNLFKRFNFDAIIHLAAESHVDRSILDPSDFIHTNVLGTINLLNMAKVSWGKNYSNKLFYHISTDEVYGSLSEVGCFFENTPYDPQSPYAASKASSDHFVRAYQNTYNLPIIISNCSNNYGPNQFPEKLIPLIINNIRHCKPLPIYGKGENIRDWLFVLDHVKAIDLIFHTAESNKTYNIGGNNEWKNIDIVKLICTIMDEKLGRKLGTSEKLITFVKDRAGHDFRYAINADKLKNELKWIPTTDFKTGINKTIDWYLKNTDWIDNVTSGEYQKYYAQQYN